MSDLLLETKLFKPVLRPALIIRQHLIDRLNDSVGKGIPGFAARLTLVSAPAGFGKTTLVSAWLVQLSDVQSAWLSLDENDNDPVRFLSYLIAAVQTAVPDLGEGAAALLRSPQPPAPEAILTLLINDISQHGRPLILVLDDYHAITTPSVHQALAFLIDHLPPLLHLLLTTRSDPTLPLSRLRARNQIAEIRASDLRFTFDEAGRFFNQVMDLSLSNEEMAALEEHTEGWIAGLQLVAIAMQSHLSRQGRDDLPDFIAAFTGSNRFILDYLTDEVLEQRPKGTRNFLLQTSILDRFCGSLCDAVTGQSESQAILEQLEQASLFLIPLDEERHWYRYHHLFADVLQNRLRQASASPTIGVAAPAELHRRASAWFEQEKLIDEAIRHALAAPDIERAASLVERNSLIMLQRSEILLIRSWLEQLPVEMVQTRPRLILAHGWVLIDTGHSQTAKAWLGAPASRTALEAPDLPADILGELTLLQATLARFRRENARSLELAQQALDLLTNDDRGLQAGAMLTIGVAHLYQGDIAAASQAFREAVTLGETKGGPYMALSALEELGELQISQGQLSQARQTSQQAMRMAARWRWQTLPAAGMAHIYFGRVLYERNDLAGAAQELAKGVNLLRGSIEQFILAQGYVTLARVRLARGNLESAFTTLQQCEDWFMQMQIADTGNAGILLALAKVRLWLEQGNLNAAIRWAQSCHWRPEDTHSGYLQAVTLVRLRLAQYRHQAQDHFLHEAAEILNRLLAAAETKAWWGDVIELSLLRALLCQVRGDTAGLLLNLEQALTLAEPEGYCRVFLDEGKPMAGLLRQARQQDLFPHYVDKLLAAFNTEEAQLGGAESLPEPLSQRELEVLQLVATGASNKDIADQLFIAVSTVKKHVGNILVKLDAPNRVQAIARARELGLLS